MPTRWLDEDEQRAWRAYLKSSRLLMDRLERELQDVAGLPHGYYEILVNLSEAPLRTLRMTDLASATYSSRSRLSHAVTKLEEMGYVERTECPTDRRGTFAHLTDVGTAALKKAAPGHVAGVRSHLFDQLTDAQVKQLTRISQALLDHLDEGDQAQSGDSKSGE
jgi:DNA-binding MarR family transcriptional regulator